MKQSLKAKLPELSEMTVNKHFIQRPFSGRKLLLIVMMGRKEGY